MPAIGRMKNLLVITSCFIYRKLVKEIYTKQKISQSIGPLISLLANLLFSSFAARFERATIIGSP